MSLELLEDRYEILDQLPESLYSTVISLAHGDLLSRVAGVLQWRSALLEGELPKHKLLNWPEQKIKITLLKRLEALNIAHYCREQEELTDLVLLDICEGVLSAEEYFKVKPDGFVDKLAQQQNKRDRDSEFEDEEGVSNETSQQQPDVGPSAEETQNQPLRDALGASGEDNYHAELELSDSLQYERDIDDGSNIEFSEKASLDKDVELTTAAQITSNHLDAKWQELVESWDELSESFNELSGFLGQGWDLTQGILASQGWRDIIRYRQLIKQMPDIKRLMKMLGRLQNITDVKAGSSLGGSIVDPMKRHVVEEEELLPQIVMEMGGLERSNELNRMLPSELAQLGNAKMKPLWYARYAERMLMTYQYQGFDALPSNVESEHGGDGVKLQKSETKGMGPVIICLDTSGSMQGEPEQIAKAVTLEALRIAFSEKRACHLYMFGGPEEVVEHQLDLTRGGLAQLLEFLQYSFHGGTDAVQPLLAALEKSSTENWRDSDILLISDGRFPLKEQVLKKINKLKKQQHLRLHGLIVGKWESHSMKKICEPLHVFDSWAPLSI